MGLDSALNVEGISKRFGGVRALQDVTLAVQAGTIHGWAGQNGAGKSTLAKIVAGATKPDAGTLRLDGVPIRMQSPREAIAHGIATVQQELAVVPYMNAVDNVFLGSELVGRFGVSRQRSQARFDELASELRFDIPKNVPVGRLSFATQQQIEILRALARDARLIVFDEPTAALTPDQAGRLHDTMRHLRDRGVTIVYVTHYLEHMLEACDTVTILRDGRLIRTSPSSEETEDSLIQGMLGATLESRFSDRPRREVGDIVLSVAGMSVPPVLRGEVDLQVRSGEILGIAGLVGSGRTELLRGIFGASTCTGQVAVDGRTVAIRRCSDAISHGIAMLPEDRKVQGLHLRRSVRENIALPHLRRLSSIGHVRTQAERRDVRRVLADVSVPSDRIESPAGTLSGGNQQRVLFAKWLLEPPKVLMIDEPTKGVDVGAKQELYALVRRLADAGVAILLVSSDFDEILGLSDRVIVLSRGRVTAELEGDALTEEALMTAAFELAG